MNDPILSRAEALDLSHAGRLRRLLEMETDYDHDDPDQALEWIAYASAASTALLQEVQGRALHRALFDGADLIDVAEAAGAPSEQVAVQWRSWAKRTRKQLHRDHSADSGLLSEIDEIEQRLGKG